MGSKFSFLPLTFCMCSRGVSKIWVKYEMKPLPKSIHIPYKVQTEWTSHTCHQSVHVLCKAEAGGLGPRARGLVLGASMEWTPARGHTESRTRVMVPAVRCSVWCVCSARRHHTLARSVTSPRDRPNRPGTERREAGAPGGRHKLAHHSGTCISPQQTMEKSDHRTAGETHRPQRASPEHTAEEGRARRVWTGGSGDTEVGNRPEQAVVQRSGGKGRFLDQGGLHRLHLPLFCFLDALASGPSSQRRRMTLPQGCL